MLLNKTMITCAWCTKTWNGLEFRPGSLNVYNFICLAIDKGILDSLYILCFSQKRNH